MSTFVVSNLNDLGAGSLRAAIAAANADAFGNSTISFAVNGTITLASDLPAVTRDVIIDGTSAPTHGAGQSQSSNLIPTDMRGWCSPRALRGLSSWAWRSATHRAAAVELDAGSITLNGDYIGLDLTGAVAGNAGDGVLVSATSAGNHIGSNPTAASGVVSNVISGNGGNGISFQWLVEQHAGRQLHRNRSRPALSAIANGGNGIWLTDGSNGNTNRRHRLHRYQYRAAQNDPDRRQGHDRTPVFVVPPLGNLVSGNGAERHPDRQQFARTTS